MQDCDQPESIGNKAFGVRDEKFLLQTSGQNRIVFVLALLHEGKPCLKLTPIVAAL